MKLADLETKLRVIPIQHRWSGHGEGGTICKIVLQENGDYNIYDQKPGEWERCQKEAKEINLALERIKRLESTLLAACDYLDKETQIDTTELKPDISAKKCG